MLNHLFDNFSHVSSHFLAHTLPSNPLNTINNMSANNASTGNSYLEKATGYVQDALGSVTGSTGDKVSYYHLPPSCYRLDIELVLTKFL